MGISETQFRDHAANERTLLAWIRTGIAFMVFGFAIARFGLFLKEVSQMEPSPQPRHAMGSAWFGVALVVLGLVTNAVATVRYRAIRRALEEQRDISMSPRLAYVVGAGSVLVAAAMAAVLARTLGD
jgi:putative membrane protein